MNRILFALIPLVVQSGCTSAQRLSYNETKPIIPGAQERRDLLIGTWYGEAVQKDGVSRRWINRRTADGSYVIELSLDDPSSDDSDREFGLWGTSGPIYFTMMRGWLNENGQIHPSDPRIANYYDAYEIIELTSDVFTYRGLETGNVFTVKRVPDDFSLN